MPRIFPSKEDRFNNQFDVEHKSPTTLNRVVGDLHFHEDDPHGTPYVFCLLCGSEVRYVEALTHKVTKLVGRTQKLVFDSKTGKVQEKWIPILKPGLGCFRCWNLQQRGKK